MSRLQKRALREAWLTEFQAISIYEAEVAILSRTAWTRGRRTSLRVCKEILSEERDHLSAVGIEHRAGPISLAASAIAGWSLGFALAVIPSRWSWVLHSLAEVQAALSYEKVLPWVTDAPLRSEIEKAALQERAHSQRFKDL